MSSKPKKLGLELVPRSDDSDLDIVFVHGLFGDRRATWTKDGVLWPAEFLPKEMPKARIFLFGYDADVVKDAHHEVTQGTITSHAGDLCNELAAVRAQTRTTEHPIVFVAHSLGGLVCAEAFTMGDRNSPNDNTALIAAKTVGMVFLGTPFGGSDLASWGEILRRMISAFKKSNQTLTGDLKRNSTRLKELALGFAQVISRRKDEGVGPELAFFYETLKYRDHMIVDKDAAWIIAWGDYTSVNANHVDMCKFSSEEDEGYRKVVESIKKVSRGKPKKKQISSNTAVMYGGTVKNQVLGNVSGDLVGEDKVAGHKIGGSFTGPVTFGMPPPSQ